MHRASERWVIYGAVVVGAYLLLTRGGTAAGGQLIPPGAQGFVPPSSPGFPNTAALLTPSIPGGGFLFPALPVGRAYTTDPATGMVYETEIAVPNQPGYVSVSDVLRGR